MVKNLHFQTILITFLTSFTNTLIYFCRCLLFCYTYHNYRFIYIFLSVTIQVCGLAFQHFPKPVQSASVLKEMMSCVLGNFWTYGTSTGRLPIPLLMYLLLFSLC